MTQNAQQLLHSQTMAHATQQPYPVLEAIITRVRGSAPTRAGDSMLLLSNGRWVGSVGGGNLEWKLMQAGQMTWWRLQETGKLPAAKTMQIDHGLGCHSDQCCGGRVEAHLVMVPTEFSDLMNDQSQRFYQFDANERLCLIGGIGADNKPQGQQLSATADLDGERLQLVSDNGFKRQAKKAPQLWIFGAGHIARELAPLAAKLDYRVSVFDGRPQWADSDAFLGTLMSVKAPCRKRLIRRMLRPSF